MSTAGSEQVDSDASSSSSDSGEDTDTEEGSGFGPAAELTDALAGLGLRTTPPPPQSVSPQICAHGTMITVVSDSDSEVEPARSHSSSDSDSEDQTGGDRRQAAPHVASDASAAALPHVVGWELTDSRTAGRRATQPLPAALHPPRPTTA